MPTIFDLNLREMLSSRNETIRRNAMSILKTLQRLERTAIEPDGKQTKEVTIYILGGVVDDVKGLPEGWTYRIEDHDLGDTDL